MASPTYQENPHIETRMGQAIRDIGIPPRPTILAAIDQEMRKEEPDFSHLAKMLGADVALAAALLKTTNSPFFGFDKKVRSVHEALLVLGLRLVMRTIAGISLKKAFKHLPDMERFWDASASTARVAGWVARQLRRHCKIRAEDAYTFALFRDCGIPVLMSPFPEYRAVLARANAERELCFTDVEDAMISMNHADVGASLAESWLLPTDIVHAIRHHHSPNRLLAPEHEQLPKEVLGLIVIAQLAEHLLYEKTGMSRTFEWEKIAALGKSVLAIGDLDIAELLSECHEAISGEDD
jgi:HD-like signal output (HDOD) protein